MTEDATDPPQLVPYVEALRARLPADQFILLMRAFNAWMTGGGRLAVPMGQDERPEDEPFTAELQSEMLTLMRLTTPP
ncbi:hypothetical protein [Streptomyces sedi]|uniref:Uncharacterized protein n=1 Tax=Streptomyces sedi TaxID=555059 RepID=A0A5C4V0M5_9ACTN|nr:hypothetical protein [Streptomyces sedi]TNM29511.1 hypothetical protein FH715_15385 [Streptomyces sedi]